jgi:formylglycine-generating enzyme required for sulfatase activity
VGGREIKKLPIWLALPFLILAGCGDMDLRNALADTVAKATIPAPGGLTATATSASAVSLTWADNSSTETGFKVERSLDGSTGWAEVQQTAAGVTNWDDTGLSAATTYYYRVCAFNAAGDSSYSNVANATPGVSPPSAPSALGASALSVSSIRLTWTDNSSNETGFKIERSPDGSTGWTELTTTAANATTYDDTLLASGTTYYYRVRGTNAGGDSSYSNTANATTGQTPPTAPSGLGASALSVSSIRLTWSDNSSNETGFKIDRSPNGSTGWTELTTTAANTITYDDSVLASGTTYYYRVSAMNAGGGSVYSNTASATTMGPIAPSGLGASSLSVSSIRLTWTDNSSNETGFKIDRSPNGSTGWTQVQLTAVNALTWDDTGLTAGTTYYYRVRATNAGGDSSYSNTANATTLQIPTAPSGLGASALSVSSIRLTWTDNSSNETGFKIDRSPNGSTGWTQVQLTAANALTWDDTGLSAGTTYYYQMRATNAGGDSGYSNTANATTLQIPTAPSGLGASALSVSSIRLTWTDNSSNETGFKIERSPNGSSGWTQVQLTAANAITYDDTVLALGTIYYYRVRATNAGGDSGYANTANATTTTLQSLSMIDIAAAGDFFTMGDGSYGPNVPETISYSYNVSKYEITNALYTQFIADGGYSTLSYWTTNGWTAKTAASWTQPAYWTDINFNGTNQPVVGVSWYEAVAFCNWRSVKEGLAPAYNSAGQATLSANGYRLPTEVEWEYAAAKGASGQTERIYAYGSGTFDPSKVVCNDLPASASKTSNVGSKSTAGDTPQGLADMSGNVWEWCSDNYEATPATDTDRYYFVNDSTSQNFMLRGGAWNNNSEYYFRCAYRAYYLPYDRYFNVVGFRVVRTGSTQDLWPTAPSGLGASALSVSSIRLTWTDNSTNETGFKIDRSPDGSTGWTQLTVTAANATTYDDTVLASGTIYYYRVRAANTGGDSVYSNTANATTLQPLSLITIGVGDTPTFTMGDGTYGQNVGETISSSYNISKYEITNAVFAQFIADGGYSTQSYWTTNGWTEKTFGAWTQPDFWTDANFNGINQPVVGVSWYEAVAFCNWRSVKEGLTPAYNSAGLASLSTSGYRLPTEVEWEYAAAKGGSGQAERIYAYGSTWDVNKVVGNTTKTASVGSKSTAGDTPQGLADMSGNVWEWCSDNYQTTPATGTDRYYFANDSTSLWFILRGGSWDYTDEYGFRCATRNYNPPSCRYDVIGFRVVCR